MLYRGRWKGVGEDDGENFNPWAERVASRTLEGLEGHDASTQVEGNEQTRRRRLEVQARAVSQAAIGDPAYLRRRGVTTKHGILSPRVLSARACCVNWYIPLNSDAHMEVPISIQLPFLRRIFLDACGYQSTLRGKARTFARDKSSTGG